MKRRKLKAAPSWIVPGALVWYEASPGRRFRAVVQGKPWQLGHGDWVVRLNQLDATYLAYNASGRDYVSCAATWCLFPRIEMQSAGAS